MQIAGAELTKARERAGLSAYAVARQMKTSRQYVAKIEASEGVSIATTYKFAEALVGLRGEAASESVAGLREAARTAAARVTEVFDRVWPTA